MIYWNENLYPQYVSPQSMAQGFAWGLGLAGLFMINYSVSVLVNQARKK